VTALIHVHTTASDGRAAPLTIARLAARAGVGVVILTDHDRLSPGAGWHHGVLLISGQELSPRHNHILLAGLESPLPKQKGDGRHGDPRKSLAQAASRGAWAALAHPLDPAIPLFASSRAFVTLDFRHLDCPGLELWNAMSAFKQDLGRPLKGLARLVMPRTFLAGPHPLLLALWDSQGRGRPWAAFAGADAHAFGSGRWWLPWRIFSYRRHMKLITTGLWLEGELSGQAGRDEDMVLQALTNGRSYLALGRAKGFQCRLQTPRGPEELPGGESVFRPGSSLLARLPGWGRARLIHNGRVKVQQVGRRFTWPLDAPGVYRVEAQRWRAPAGWRPWIFCNPFYLRQEA
jgi:hypothetical protein